MPATLCLSRAPLRTPLNLVACLVEPALRSRLATLGLRSGARIEVVQRTGGDGRVIAVAGSRVALDRQTLDRLIVRMLA